MRRYELQCPKCGNTVNDDGDAIVMLPSDMPENPWCTECQETIELDNVRDFIKGWQPFIKDVDALKQREQQEKKAAEQAAKDEQKT